VIRCYDPCPELLAHAIGQMTLHLRLLAPDGTVRPEPGGERHRRPGRRLRQLPAQRRRGVGWHAAGRLAADPRLIGARVLARHQLAPELAEDISRAMRVVLVDASADGDPGATSIRRVRPSPAGPATWSITSPPKLWPGWQWPCTAPSPRWCW
jgi:hypothetical protein